MYIYIYIFIYTSIITILTVEKTEVVFGLRSIILYSKLHHLFICTSGYICLRASIFTTLTTATILALGRTPLGHAKPHCTAGIAWRRDQLSPKTTTTHKKVRRGLLIQIVHVGRHGRTVGRSLISAGKIYAVGVPLAAAGEPKYESWL